ncbi:MAG: hypothetical protein ACM3OC_05720 [Deltaproteobacteria bacterium]
MFLFSILALSIPCTCRAAEMVKVDKTKIRLSVTPGQASTGVINIENPSKDIKSIRAYQEDWVYLAPYDGSKDFKPSGTGPSSAGSWITFSPSELTLAPYGKGKISYTVKVPESAVGCRQSALFVESTSPSNENEGVGVNLALRVAVLFFVEAEGTVKRDIALQDLSVKRTGAKGMLTIALPFKNTGNTDLTVGGTYNIMGANGMIAARGELANSYTLPGNTGNLQASWSLPIAPGDYSLVLTLDIGKAVEEAGMGRGPVIVKEASLKIGADGSVAGIGALK